jgi:hypothetical protein
MNRKIIISYFLYFAICTLFSCGSKKNSNTESATQESEKEQEKSEVVADDKQKKLTQGCELKKEFFDQAEVFEPLAKNMPENQSPSKVSLEQFAPKRLSQGSQGSCTAWACAYAAMTINQARATQIDPNTIAFSPAFVYNQITRGNCTGTHIGKTLDKLVNEGGLSLNDFPYDDSDCRRQPNNAQMQRAEQFKIKGYNRLTMKDDDYRIDLEAIKQNITQGAPVVIGMAVGGTFYKIGSEGVWRPTERDFAALKKGTDGHIVDDGAEAAVGGHAMCVIGFDENY